MSHFARAGLLDVLEQITTSYRRLTTQAVREEIERGVAKHQILRDVLEAPWLEVVHVDGLSELVVVAEYMRRLGSGERDMGEATVLAWAEVHGAIALIDERVGTRHGHERSVEVHGTLWLMARAAAAGKLTHPDASGIVQRLSDADASFPCDGKTFIDWARREGLLPDP